MTFNGFSISNMVFENIFDIYGASDEDIPDRSEGLDEEVVVIVVLYILLVAS